ncbi:MAG: UDP-N-acetylglucosamine 1-carboxyvinyltransferase, partial [Gammaproteobacteria bacterium]
MDKLLITGNGPLHGEVAIAGAKNAALPVIAASLLTSDPLQFSNIPAVRDIATALELMKRLGCKVDRQETELGIDTSQVHSVRVPYELVKTMRGSILLLGPLLARFG